MAEQIQQTLGTTSTSWEDVPNKDQNITSKPGNLSKNGTIPRSIHRFGIVQPFHIQMLKSCVFITPPGNGESTIDGLPIFFLQNMMKIQLYQGRVTPKNHHRNSCFTNMFSLKNPGVPVLPSLTTIEIAGLPGFPHKKSRKTGENPALQVSSPQVTPQLGTLAARHHTAVLKFQVQDQKTSCRHHHHLGARWQTLPAIDSTSCCVLYGSYRVISPTKSPHHVLRLKDADAADAQKIMQIYTKQMHHRKPILFVVANWSNKPALSTSAHGSMDRALPHQAAPAMATGTRLRKKVGRQLV